MHPTLRIIIVSLLALLVSMDAPLEAISDPIGISWIQLTTESVVGLDWSPTGDDLVTGLRDTDEIIILNWQTSEISRRFTFPDEALPYTFSAEWSPDGQFIATFAHDLYVLDPQTGQLRVLREAVDEFGYDDVDWSPDSNAVAAIYSRGYVDIVSLESGDILQTIDIAGGEMERAENSGWLYVLFDWSPDGNLFAAPHQMQGIAGEPPVMGFWDLEGNLLEDFTRENLADTMPATPCSANAYLLMYALDVQWANDSRTLAVSGGDGYGVCRLNIDGTIEQHHISDIPQDSLRWSPEQQWLAASQRASDTCALRISAVAQDYETYELQIDSEACYINTLAWSPDSQHLAAATDNGLWIGTLELSEQDQTFNWVKVGA